MKPIYCFFLALVFPFIGTAQTISHSYNDSLDGFDRQALNAALLANRVFGQEYLSCVQSAERTFIDQKYSLHGNVTFPASQSSAGHHTIGGTNTTLNAPCVNEGFESTVPGAYTGAGNATAINGWSISSYFINSGLCRPASPTYTPGSTEAWVVATPVLNLPAIGTLPNSPFGGNNVVQLNDIYATGLQTRLKQTFPVTSSNTLFELAFAGAWEDGGHNCCTQSGLTARLYDCNGTELSCYTFSFLPAGGGCPLSTGSFSIATINGVQVSWTNWQTKTFDLTPFVGTCITVEVVNSDCTAGGHYGTAYFDSRCSLQNVIGSGLPGTNVSPVTYGPVSFCAGSSQAVIQAPLGYASYQWVSPTTGIISAANGGTASSYTVMNPVPNSVYTVNLSTNNGCMFTATYPILTSNVNIVGTYTSSACSAGIANGTASVIANGSGTGYNYSWVNSLNIQVGTTATLSNVLPGTYSITVTASGVSGCGTAVKTITIPVAPPTVINTIKTYCGSTAYLQSPGAGTNFQWYTNVTPIPAAQGGTAQSLAVTSPVNGSVYRLGYLTSAGCRDSIKFTLVPGNGQVSVLNNPSVCPGASVAPTISLTPTSLALPGNNSFTVVSTGTTAPYSATLNPTALYSYTAASLTAGGTYSVAASDGDCYYTTTFTVGLLAQPFTLNIATLTPTLCSGQSGNFSAVVTNPAQYTYSWSPNVFLSGNTSQNVVITPLSGSGSTANLVYTVTVKPTAANCPQTKTVGLMVVNLATPLINPVPVLCSNAADHTISVSPAGGEFYTPGTSSPIGLTNGILTPGLAQAGVHTFTYVIASGACSVSSSSTYTINAVPVITITGQSTVCENAIVSWTASGADLYTFNPATATSGLFTAPAATTVYTITATTLSTNCSSTALKTLTVNPLPVISIIGADHACAGETVSWQATGGDTYAWSSVGPGTASFTAPSSTTVYTVTVAFISTSCSAVKTKTLSIDACVTGIQAFAKDSDIKTYPNPVLHELMLETAGPVHVILYSEPGSVILEKDLQSGVSAIDMTGLSSGVYFLKTMGAKGVKVMKVVKAKE